MGTSFSTASDVALAGVLVVSAVTDLRLHRIFNVVTYPAILAGLIGAAAGFGPPFGSALTGCLVGGLSFYVLFAAGWMGGGDVKLMAAVGAFKGFPFILHAMFYSIFMGGVCAALVLIWRGQMGAVLGDIAALARQVTAGGALHRDVIPARGGAFPFGVAIGVGTAAALALQ